MYLTVRIILDVQQWQTPRHCNPSTPSVFSGLVYSFEISWHFSMVMDDDMMRFQSKHWLWETLQLSSMRFRDCWYTEFCRHRGFFQHILCRPRPIGLHAKMQWHRMLHQQILGMVTQNLGKKTRCWCLQKCTLQIVFSHPRCMQHLQVKTLKPWAKNSHYICLSAWWFVITIAFLHTNEAYRTLCLTQINLGDRSLQNVEIAVDPHQICLTYELFLKYQKGATLCLTKNSHWHTIIRVIPGRPTYKLGSKNK